MYASLQLVCMKIVRRPEEGGSNSTLVRVKIGGNEKGFVKHNVGF